MKNSIILALLLILASCGQKNHSSSDNKRSAVKKAVEEARITPEEEVFITDLQEEHKLPEASVESVITEFEKQSDPYTKANLMFCVGAGGAAVLDFIGFTCRSFKGDKIELEFIGIGLSFSVHTDVLVLYAKKGSRHLKEGTYNVSLSGLHFGLGLLGLKIFNDNLSINWRMKGLTLGLGMNMSAARMTVRKI